MSSYCPLVAMQKLYPLLIDYLEADVRVTSLAPACALWREENWKNPQNTIFYLFDKKNRYLWICLYMVNVIYTTKVYGE